MVLRLYLSTFVFALVMDAQNMTIEDMWRILHQLQEQNNNMRSTFEQQQAIHAPAPSAPVPAISVHHQTKEPRISLPKKFDGNWSKFQGFVNQVRLVLRLHPQQYATKEFQVDFIGMLLYKATFLWFYPYWCKILRYFLILKTFLKNSPTCLARPTKFEQQRPNFVL